MTLYRKRYRIESIRLPNYDYSQEGKYFITICTHNRQHLFGKIVNRKMQLSEFGKTAQFCWEQMPEHFNFVTLDEFVIMPNHVHGIIVLNDNNKIDISNNTKEEFSKSVPGSVPTIIRSYKSAVTKKINELRKTLGEKVWQSGFYDRIIKDQTELYFVQKYIKNNPHNWNEDELRKAA